MGCNDRVPDWNTAVRWAFGGRLASIPLLAACLLVLMAVVVYLPAVDGEFLYDDAIYVTGDERITTLDGLGHIWTEVSGPEYCHQYYPLTSSGFWLQYQLWGYNPTGYHLVNILLHALNAVLFRRLLSALRVPGAWLAAAIFAVHPVHVPSVAWIAELKNVLSACFFLVSMLVFTRVIDLDGQETQARRRRWLYAAGIGLFVLALLSKTASGVLPLALLIVLWWKRGRVTRRELAALVPFVALAGGFVLLTSWLEAQHATHGETFSLTWMERTFVAGRALWFYATKLLWPAGLSIVYPRWIVSWPMVIYPLAAVASGVLLWRLRGRLGRGVPAALIFFAVALAPVSFVNVSFHQFSFVADHWQYWASMGFTAGVVGAIVTLARRWQDRSPVSAGAPALAALVVMTLGTLTWQRAHVFERAVTLWSDAAEKNPGSLVVHYNLGAAHLARGDDGAAAGHFHEATRLDPGHARSHNNLGVALVRLGRLDEAIESYRRAITASPGLARAHLNLGLALQEQELFEEADRSFAEARRLDPRLARGGPDEDSKVTDGDSRSGGQAAAEGRPVFGR
jgi:hypothetical protein